MTTTESEALSRAIDYLDATEVAPGKYAYRDDGTHRYYVVSEVTLADLGEHLAAPTHGTGDEYDPAYTYSAMCSDWPSTAMPQWWTPEQQYAWRVSARVPDGMFAEDAFGEPGEELARKAFAIACTRDGILFPCQADATEYRNEMLAERDDELSDRYVFAGSLAEPERITASLETGEEIPA